MQKPKETETTKTSVRVPRVIWERVKILAIRRGTTAQDLIQQAIRNILKEGGER